MVGAVGEEVDSGTGVSGVSKTRYMAWKESSERPPAVSATAAVARTRGRARGCVPGGGEAGLEVGVGHEAAGMGWPRSRWSRASRLMPLWWAIQERTMAKGSPAGMRAGVWSMAS
jgi:hypothetical protein